MYSPFLPDNQNIELFRLHSRINLSHFEEILGHPKITEVRLALSNGVSTIAHHKLTPLNQSGLKEAVQINLTSFLWAKIIHLQMLPYLCNT